MANKKRKRIKIVGITLLVLMGLLIAIPLLLEGKMATVIKNKVNQNVNATLNFKEAQLSLLKSFPDAYLDLKGVSLVNKAPFEGDTLFSAGEIELDLSIKELFKGAQDPIGIKRLVLDKAKLHIKVDAEENANYDIALDDGESTPTEDSTNNFTFDVQEYALTDATILYDDFSSGMHLEITEMNHSGSGDLSLENSELQTQTNALVSFELDSTQYLNKNKVALEALIGIDLKQNKYTFLKNEALVNQLPLVFDGFVKVNETNQEVDINFQTPSSDFKNFLAVIPEAYSKNIEQVQTSGNFEVKGVFKGVVDDEHIPAFDITMISENASFKYPDLPKTVKNVFIDTQIKNETGISEDTYVDINRLSFQIDEDVFTLNAKIRELLGNTKVNLHADGILNLAKLAQAYPIADYDLSGILNADITTAFDMASLENHSYQNTKTSGKARLTGFHYESEELKNPVDIKEAALTFNPKTVTLNAFEGNTGQTDFKASGTIDNLLGYVFNDEKIEGRFQLQSNTLALNDFMVEETAETETSEIPESTERIKIPSFLDATIDASAGTVLYDNLNLKNVSGRLKIQDETATLENLTSELFDGKLNLNGAVSTKGDTSTFDLAMGVDSFKISESFKALGLFKALAPIATALQGKLNSDIKISGNLKDDMTPNLATLSGDVLAQLLSTQLNAENAPLLTALDGKLDFLDLKALDLNNLKTALSFDNGAAKVKPFTINYKDIAIKVDGSHTFDSKLNYTATLDVPAKYLGSEVNNLIAKIDDNSLENLTIPVTANMGGNFTSPSVQTDLTSGIKQLTAQLVEIQKQKLVNEGKDKAKDLIGGLLGGNTADSTQTDSTQTSGSSAVKEALGGLVGNQKKDSTATQDSTSAESGAKNAAKNILGGLLGKKKKDSTKQD